MAKDKQLDPGQERFSDPLELEEVGSTTDSGSSMDWGTG